MAVFLYSNLAYVSVAVSFINRIIHVPFVLNYAFYFNFEKTLFFFCFKINVNIKDKRKLEYCERVCIISYHVRLLELIVSVFSGNSEISRDVKYHILRQRSCLEPSMYPLSLATWYRRGSHRDL